MNKDIVLIEARSEYQRYMNKMLIPILYDRIIEMYKDVESSTPKKNQVRAAFQLEMRKIPKWNSDQIEYETQKVLTQCPWFKQLLSAIHLSTIKILTSVKLGKYHHKISVNIPKVEIFIHKVYKHLAKRIFENSEYFGMKNFQNTNKLREALSLFTEDSIDEALQDMLPLENILYTNLKPKEDSENEDDSGSEDEDSEEEPEEQQNNDKHHQDHFTPSVEKTPIPDHPESNYDDTNQSVQDTEEQFVPEEKNITVNTEKRNFFDDAGPDPVED